MHSIVLIGLVIVIAIAVLINNVRTTAVQPSYAEPVPPAVDQTIPDSPVGFGYKCMWFAVKTDDNYQLAELLKLKNASDCNWEVGVKMAYKGAVFVTPSIDGWTLACGWGLPHGDTKESIDEVKNILKILSQEFGEAQFFCTHRVTEYHCWMKASNGQIDRVYAFSGESGENIAIEGPPTEFEQNLNLANTFSAEAKDESYFDREDLIWPDEELLMEVAEHWSINPTTFDDRKDIAPSLGLVGQRQR